ncbi:MAG TPA: hypothetical protein IGR89_12320 [Oscillatoriaceae cyanobacterium M7585_C2015_266]|nr:hypothetical protein [Oscillatoriaceae cyanobacterium M7585_C2015_266]
MRFVTPPLDHPKPTVLEVLVVENEPRQFLPAAYIQLLRIEGSELTDPIKDNKEISRALPNLLRTCYSIPTYH